MILSPKYAKELTAVETPVRRSEILGSANNNSNKFLLPPECFICGIYCKKCSKRVEYTCILLTKDGEQTIRLAAEHKLPLFYRNNKAIDLILSELRFHELCYKTFTYGYSNSFTEEKLDLHLLNKSQSEDLQEQGNYEDVKQYINQHVLTNRNAVSLNALHTIYGLHPYDQRYCLKLKNRIMKDFKEKAAILTSEKKRSDIVVDAFALPTEIAFKDKEGCMIKAAEYLKNDVLKHCEGLSELTWPSQLDKLQDEKRNPPESLMLFCKHLLQSKSTLNKTNQEYVQRLSNSFASDIIAVLSQGKTIISTSNFY